MDLKILSILLIKFLSPITGTARVPLMDVAQAARLAFLSFDRQSASTTTFLKEICIVDIDPEKIRVMEAVFKALPDCVPGELFLPFINRDSMNESQYEKQVASKRYVA